MLRARKPLTFLCGVACAAAIASCKRPATVIEVILESNAEADRALSLRACATWADEPASTPQCQTFTHGGGSSIEPFFASFGARPGAAWDERRALAVTVTVDVAGDDARPRVRFERRIVATPTPRAATQVRVFLPVECGAPSIDCAQPHDDGCTVSNVCIEQAKTCGDDSTCVAPEVTPVPATPDASLPPRRDAQVDAAMQSAAPALRYPWAGMVLGGARPLFTWAFDGRPVALQVCADRPCSTFVYQRNINAGASTHRAESDLPLRGTMGLPRLFWRVVALNEDQSLDSARASATWPFTVRAGRCTEGPSPDLNGDAYADLAISGLDRTPADAGVDARPGFALPFTGRATPGAGPAVVFERLDAAASDASDAQAPQGFAFWRGSLLEQFGASTAIADLNGDGAMGLVIGAPGASDNTGAIATIPGDQLADTWRPALRVAVGSAPGAQLGRVMASAGDVDLDGAGDVVVGGDNAAWVLYGSRTASPSLVAFERPASAAAFGAAVAGGCDASGDRRADVIVGAPLATNARGEVVGAVYVFTPTANRSRTPAYVVMGTTVGARFGAAVACGDLDGDEVAELIVGAPDAEGGLGQVVVFTHRMSLPFSERPPRITGARPGEHLGASLAAGRDFNGDGACDVLVGQAALSALQGQVSVYFGPGLTAGTGALQDTTGAVGDRFGSTVSLIGDIDGDGTADAMIGAPFHSSGGEPQRGSYLTVYGGSAAPPSGMRLVPGRRGEDPGTNLGLALSR